MRGKRDSLVTFIILGVSISLMIKCEVVAEEPSKMIKAIEEFNAEAYVHQRA